MDNAENRQEFFLNLFHYIMSAFYFSLIFVSIFVAPIYFVLKLKKAIYFLFFISLFLVVEYFVYTYLASEADKMNGVYNGIVSILFLFLFFFKHIRSLFDNVSQ